MGRCKAYSIIKCLGQNTEEKSLVKKILCEIEKPLNKIGNRSIYIASKENKFTYRKVMSLVVAYEPEGSLQNSK